MIPRLVMVVAMGRNRAIGLGNQLPWRIPSDLRHFRALTMGKPVIMGRKTYESIGRPLPGRALIVVSRSPAFQAPAEVAVARDPDEAVAHAASLASARGADEIVVAGGAMVYEALIGAAQRLYVTEVDLEPEADALFPPIDPALWSETSRLAVERASGDDASFAFVSYQRR